VLASGRGSNLGAVLEATRAGQLPALGLEMVIVDRPGSGASQLAREFRVPVCTLDFASFPQAADFQEALLMELRKAAPDLILALGFMRILSGPIITEFNHRIINIHPSLLPAFPGMAAQKQALEYGVRITGATVHFMDAGVDTGAIIAQSSLEMDPDWDLDRLKKELLPLEHRLVVRAAQLFSEDCLEVQGRKVIIKEKK